MGANDGASIPASVSKLGDSQKCLETCMALERIGRQPDSIVHKLSEHNVTDYWLPIPKQTLRHLLGDSQAEKAFYNMQEDTLSFSWDGMIQSHEQDPKHYAFEDGDEMLTINKLLGEGGYGIVEEVTLLTTPEPIVCVRKRLGRPRQLKAQKQILEAFVREVHVMRQVKHHHCVQFMGSYTDYESLAILLAPVADMDLATCLNLPDLSEAWKAMLGRSIGCLCTALSYLHQKKIIHKDLKPQNILIHGDNILLTDFGFSVDFSDGSISTTTGRPAAWTARYSAPEVLHFEPRNRAADIWSLGCVLVEIISALCGYSLSIVQNHWRQNGNCQPSFALNPVATTTWLSKLMQEKHQPNYSAHCQFLEKMLDPHRSKRPSAQQVLVDILTSQGSSLLKPQLVGKCCWIQGNEPLPMSREAVDLKNIWVEPFFPHQYDNWTYILIDLLDFTFLASNNSSYKAGNLPFATHTIVRIRNAQEYILETASMTGTTEPFWRAHDEKGQKIRKRRNGIADALRSMNMVSLNQIVYTALHCTVQIDGPQQESNGRRFRTVFITLLPICMPDSECYGSFFFMLSFKSDTEFGTEADVQRFNAAAEYLGEVTDLTLDA